MRATLKEFISSLIHSWFARMSGPLGVPLLIWGFYASGIWLKVGLFATSAACFVFCSFWLWRIERLARISVTEELRILRESGPDLEIYFDPENHAKKFWSMESAKDYHNDGYVTFWEYRVEVRNISKKTIRSVQVSREIIGPLPHRAVFMKFDATKTEAIDINPGHSALVPIVQWTIPIIQAGNLAGESAEAYGPIQVIATGNDTPAVIRLFRFNYQKTPMIYD